MDSSRNTTSRCKLAATIMAMIPSCSSLFESTGAENTPAIVSIEGDNLDQRIREADLAQVVEGHPDMSPMDELLEESASDFDSVVYILENMQTWEACRWRIAAAMFPELTSELCDAMVTDLGERITMQEIETWYAGEPCFIR
jgi:hypothetical protein